MSALSNSLFAASRAFDIKSTQRDIFRAIWPDIAEYIFGGASLLILALGDIVAGKSFTLFGTKSQPGLCLRLMEAILDGVEKQGGANQWKV